MKYLIVLLLLGCGHDIDALKMGTDPDGGVADANIADVQLSEEADTLPRITDALPPLPDVGEPDAGPPVDVVDACQRLRNVWYAYMLDTAPRCDHFCPWVDRPGPCDAAAVDLCEGAIGAAAEAHDCAEYEYRLQNDIICDETACG